MPSVGVGAEVRETLVVDGDGSRFAFGEVFGMEQPDHRQQVPRSPVVGHFVVILVALDDGVEFRPAEIALDGRAGIHDLFSQLEGVLHDRRVPFGEEFPHGGDVVDDVELRALFLAVAARHDREHLHLAGHQFAPREGRDAVGRAVEQFC